MKYYIYRPTYSEFNPFIPFNIYESPDNKTYTYVHRWNDTEWKCIPETDLLSTVSTMKTFESLEEAKHYLYESSNLLLLQFQNDVSYRTKQLEDFSSKMKEYQSNFEAYHPELLI